VDKLSIQVIVCGDKSAAKLTFGTIREALEAIEKLQEEAITQGITRSIICNYFWSSVPLVKSE